MSLRHTLCSGSTRVALTALDFPASSEATSVASLQKLKENNGHESETEPADRFRSGRRETQTVAQSAQYLGEDGGGSPESPAGAGEPVHGVREPAGQYESPQDPDDDSENQSKLGFPCVLPGSLLDLALHALAKLSFTARIVS